jgi:hypothetical protein
MQGKSFGTSPPKCPPHRRKGPSGSGTPFLSPGENGIVLDFLRKVFVIYKRETGVFELAKHFLSRTANPLSSSRNVIRWRAAGRCIGERGGEPTHE